MTHRNFRLDLELLEDRNLMSTCHVTRLTDVGAGMGFRGDLRYCINKVNAVPGSDVIDFRVGGTLKLNTGLPFLTSDIKIQGPGAALLTIDAQQRARVFFVTDQSLVEISGVSLIGGFNHGNAGGGIYNNGGLVLRDCAMTENHGFRFGGAIFNSGTLLVSNCSISENRLTHFTGSFYSLGGGIYNAAGASLLVRDSLISDNEINPSYS